MLFRSVEKRYPQIDREALAIRWACERCEKHLIVSSFVIETDHQPLIPLFNNPHSRPLMRNERRVLYLQQFDYQLKYYPDKQNAEEYLSRHMLPLTESDFKTNEAKRQVVHSIITDTVRHAISLVGTGTESQEVHSAYSGWQSSGLQIRSRPDEVRTGVP